MDLHYADDGDGPLMMLLHGGALDHGMWEPQTPALTDRWRVVRPDAPGHGKSPTPKEPCRHDHVLADLIEELDHGPAILVGLSMGAGTATALAIERPELVGRLVVSGAGPTPPDFTDPWLLSIRDEWSQATVDRDLERWMDAYLALAAGPHRRLSDVPAQVLTYLRETATATVHAHAEAAPPAEPDLHDRLDAITVPTLAIIGEDDSPDHIRLARAVAETGADGRVVTIADTAHYPNLEQPDRFSDVLLQFLDGTSR